MKWAYLYCGSNDDVTNLLERLTEEEARNAKIVPELSPKVPYACSAYTVFWPVLNTEK